MAAYMARHGAAVKHWNISSSTNGWCSYCWRQHGRSASTADAVVGRKDKGAPAVPTVKVGSVNIPRRVKKTPTSVLEALASTVKLTNKNTADANLIDSPYVSHSGINQKLACINYKLQGKKAAQHMIQLNATNLQHDPSVPHIKAFKAEIPYLYKETSEKALQERIARRRVKPAMEMYEELASKGEKLQQETQEDLLDLLLVFSHKDPPAIQYPEERFHSDKMGKVLKGSVQIKDKLNWNESCMAQLLFDEMPEKSVRVYSSMIRAMEKYAGKEDYAFKLYNEMKNQNMKVSPPVYVALLSMISTTDKFFRKMTDVLTDMKEANVPVTADIFNAILANLSVIRRNNIGRARDMFFRVFGEMKHLGIAPSLRTFYYALKLFFPSSPSISTVGTSDLMMEILDEAEKFGFLISHPDDAKFLEYCLDVACRQLENTECVIRICKMLTKGANYVYLDTADNIRYFGPKILNHFMTQGPDTLMEHFGSYVPVLAEVNFGQFMDILQMFEAHGSYEHLPQIFEWLKCLHHTHFEFSTKEICVLQKLLAIMASEEARTSAGVEVLEKFANVACNINEIKVEARKLKERGRENCFDVKLSNVMVDYLIKIALNAGRIQQAVDTVKIYIESVQRLDSPQPEVMMPILRALCDGKNDSDSAMYIAGEIVQYYPEMAIDVVQTIRASQLRLTEEQSIEVESFLHKQVQI